MNNQEEKVCEFISTFYFYDLEKQGNKCYTIRDNTYRNQSKIKGAIHIRIRKGYTSESFIRRISHLLTWKDNIIIAWRGDYEK